MRKIISKITKNGKTIFPVRGKTWSENQNLLTKKPSKGVRERKEIKHRYSYAYAMSSKKRHEEDTKPKPKKVRRVRGIKPSNFISTPYGIFVLYKVQVDLWTKMKLIRKKVGGVDGEYEFI